MQSLQQKVNADFAEIKGEARKVNVNTVEIKGKARKVNANTAEIKGEEAPKGGLQRKVSADTPKNKW
jgi:hypothetical protein